jgi:hypothetical protein
MFQFHTVTEDERKRMQSREAIIPPSDARAYGMVTARNANGGRKYPRTSAPEITGDCVVTTADGHRYTIARRVRTSKSNHRAKINVDTLNAIDKRRVITAALLAPIGDSNH